MEASDATPNLLAKDLTNQTYTDKGLVKGKSYFYLFHSVDPAGNESTNKRPMEVKVVKGSTSPLPGTPEYQQNLLIIKKDLKSNSSGEDVKKLQKFLVKQELLKTKSFGYFGPLTKKAVMQFQQNNPDETLAPDNLASPNGIVKGATRDKINKLLLAGN
jgi:hypothetical protein